jgi:DNA-binding NarL/FixJ family response regulator
MSQTQQADTEPKRNGAARVLIVDDHPAVREGLAARIAHLPDLEVCGEAADIPQAKALMESAKPDVVVIDISLKSGSGIDLIKWIRARHKKARLLVCSMYPDSLYAERALRAGAQGYINKENTTGHIVDAIRTVRDGRIFLSDESIERLIPRAVQHLPGYVPSPIKLLSNRELDVFKRIGEGQTTAEIAKHLELSIYTIETYRRRIKLKLNVQSAVQLGRAATQWVLEEKKD